MVTIQVSSNGILSFRDEFTEFRVSAFPIDSVPLIAPLWGDYDFRQRGSISFRVASDEATLSRVTRIVNFSDFSPTLCVIITWNDASIFLTSQFAVSERKLCSYSKMWPQVDPLIFKLKTQILLKANSITF